jgi:hypothetical protein
MALAREAVVGKQPSTNFSRFQTSCLSVRLGHSSHPKDQMGPSDKFRNGKHVAHMSCQEHVSNLR